MKFVLDEMDNNAFVPVEIEFDVNFHGGDYTAVGSHTVMFLSPDRLEDDDVKMSFELHTGHKSENIIHWRIMEEDETVKANQLYLRGLLDEIVFPEMNGEDNSIDSRFQSFHGANPRIASMLTQMALQLKRSGIEQYGVKALYEVLRYQVAMATGRSGFKLNNNYTSRYARLIMDLEPTLSGFFKTRVLRS